MSAYMLENKKLAQMAGYIAREACAGNIPRYKALDLYRGTNGKIKAELLYQALYEMNKEAIFSRYDDTDDMVPPLIPINARVFSSLNNPVDFVSLADCYLYQCAEGDAPENNELYKLMIDICGYVATSYIRTLDGYSWG